tara:strand:- start:1259 stop:1981 length:723 start_codon:yes stop_codon:yes gene_type:complete
LSIYSLTYKLFGTSAILIEWPANIDENIIQDIVIFERKIVRNKAILDTVISYNSLLLKYRKGIPDFTSTTQQLKELYKTKVPIEKQPQRLWQIPVCYELSFGIDLEEIANQKQCSIQEIIDLHTAGNYLIYFIGFLPGFLYLGGLHPQLHSPRRSNPRVRVDKGAVGIGGAQTGVYPQDSSGGWNIIGKSPVNFFNIKKSNPCFAKLGDRIQFVSIELAVFHQLEKEVTDGTYTFKYTLL